MVPIAAQPASTGMRIVVGAFPREFRASCATARPVANVINLDPLLQVYVTEKPTINLVFAAHRHPSPLKRVTMRKSGNLFSTAC